MIYTLTLLALQYLLKITFANEVSFTTIPHMIYYIMNFSKLKYLYIGLVLALTGLPPFLLFFIKFHFLIQASNKLGFIGFMFTFFLLFLNMLFYIQFTIVKNITFDWKVVKLRQSNLSINQLLLINTQLFIFFSSLFFLPDLILSFNIIL